VNELSSVCSQLAVHGSLLSLPLFVFRVLADHPHHALAVDDLAFIANLLN
jgi:hypothetical protein